MELGSCSDWALTMYFNSFCGRFLTSHVEPRGEARVVIHHLTSDYATCHTKQSTDASGIVVQPIGDNPCDAIGISKTP
jgi:hypothetical protein